MTAAWGRGLATIADDGAGVDLVGDKVVQLHHVDVADDDLLIDALARAAVEQGTLAGRGKLGLLEGLADLLFRDAVEQQLEPARQVAERDAGGKREHIATELCDRLVGFALVDLRQHGPAQRVEFQRSVGTQHFLLSIIGGLHQSGFAAQRFGERNAPGRAPDG